MLPFMELKFSPDNPFLPPLPEQVAVGESKYEPGLTAGDPAAPGGQNSPMNLAMRVITEGQVNHGKRTSRKQPLDLDAVEEEFEKIQSMSPEEQVIAGVVRQSMSVQDSMRQLSAMQVRFLRMRMLTTTDTEARHMSGRVRPKSNKLCGCTREKKGWMDLHEQTVMSWKKQSGFSMAYQMLMDEPVNFAATRLEMLAPSAVEVYATVIENPEAKDADRLKAAKDVLVASGLTRDIGQQSAQNTLQNTMLFQNALARWKRGQQLNAVMLEVLKKGGINVDRQPQFEVRTLDGDDVVDATFRDVDLPV